MILIDADALREHVDALLNRIKRTASAYECGEESALLAVLQMIAAAPTVQPVGISEQLPRVLTKREANEWMKEGKPYFMEVNQAFAGVWLTPYNYGVAWRCWPYRPTEEQREATPWHD